MSRSANHKFIGRWKAGLETIVPINIQKMWNRWNFSVDEMKAIRQKIREKIADDEMKNEVN